MKEEEVVTWFPYGEPVEDSIVIEVNSSHVETRSKELFNRKSKSELKIHFLFWKYRYMYPNFGELMQFFVISREASVIVLICAELQIAFLKLG